MKIAVIGAGGVGAYFGGRLAQVGEEVTFIARGAHLTAMQQTGLRVDSIKGDFLIHPVRATDDPAQVGPVDYVLVAVKAWQVRAAAESLFPLLGPQTVVIPLQNGVEAAGDLQAVLADHAPGCVAGGLCRIISRIVAPGHIRHAASEPSIAFGELDGSDGRRLEPLRLAFARAGVNCTLEADIQQALWLKFIFIAAISGVGAVTRVPFGRLRSLPESRELLQAALAEAAALGRALGVNLPADVVERTLAAIDNLAPDGMASMQRDILEGRPSELEAQNGALVRLGRQAGVATPAHQFIYAALLPQEQQARQSAQERPQ